MVKVIDWLKQRGWLLVVILLVLLLVKDGLTSLVFKQYGGFSGGGGVASVDRGGDYDLEMPSPVRSMIEPEVPPVESGDRLVIKDTNLSLLVDSVSESMGMIEKLAQVKGGYLVESNLNRPEGKETGTITIRIPTEKREETLEEIKKLGVRVVSETVIGQDVTDEYVDIEGRLASLLRVKTRLEVLLEKAEKVQEILEVQREIANLEAQIDSLKGQQKYLEQSAKLSKLTVYLATDELALPYAPDKAWRPGAIFKQAVRSLIKTARGLGSVAIWLSVYAPVWLPMLGLWWWWKKRK